MLCLARLGGLEILLFPAFYSLVIIMCLFKELYVLGVAHKFYIATCMLPNPSKYTYEKLEFEAKSLKSRTQVFREHNVWYLEPTIVSGQTPGNTTVAHSWDTP